MVHSEFCHRITAENKFQVYHDLMREKVKHIILVSSPYDAWVMEEDCNLSERLANEYRGLNLSSPPRLTWISSPEDIPSALEKRPADMVILMSGLAERELIDLKQRIDQFVPDLPVVVLTHREVDSSQLKRKNLDHCFLWTGDAELLLAIVKLTEDKINIDADTREAGIRNIILVEDSPSYISSFLPILYRALVQQAQAVIQEGLNQEHRLLVMRARPKILVAETYEEAMEYFRQYEQYVLGVISDVRYPRNGKIDPSAGVALLSEIKKESKDIPLLLASSESVNKWYAKEIPCEFIDKNSPLLLAELHRFVSEHLGFGDFVFRNKAGVEIDRAHTMYQLKEKLNQVPDDVFLAHCLNNDFSRWFFARTETELACLMRPLTPEDFDNSVEAMRAFVIEQLHNRLHQRQRGIVVSFKENDFDPQTDFLKIGEGSIGGKARSLAFMFRLIEKSNGLSKKYHNIDIITPKVLSIATEGFDSFLRLNDLGYLADEDFKDDEVVEICLKAKLPEWLKSKLRIYLEKVKKPLAIRSSSLLEDAQYQAYAGLYSTVMLTNTNPDIEVRYAELAAAIKKVYASTFFQSPKSFSRRVKLRTDEEKMGVIIQEIIGRHYDEYFYPAISGVAQSKNFYPFGRMKTDDGIASIAMGLGKTVMDGGQVLRFCPKCPHVQPQAANLQELLKNSQSTFYSLYMGDPNLAPKAKEQHGALIQRRIHNAEPTGPISFLASSYLPQEGVIRDTASFPGGSKVLLFAQVLKHGLFPLPALLNDLLALAEEAMGGPVELEFCVNMDMDGSNAELALLQLRPMSSLSALSTVTITKRERAAAFCYSKHALGNAESQDVCDIIFIHPDDFDVTKTMAIKQEIQERNKQMLREERKYILVGPGRWGTSDRFLGIPVTWNDISSVSAIIETFTENLRVEPSQGSHFFHCITTLGINYVMITNSNEEFIHWEWLANMPVHYKGDFITHIQFESPITIKVDGRTAECAMLRPAPQGAEVPII
ncbi:PEP/pyruvate-binding domain-containing protein [Halodesulfovibrio marinisediminis]|uniref:Pyruvate phosphate dikinase, PEP/pyruvate binding domain n=1 Tax=Halodesulfovibrio marinisediminis DSM 17456 TaxID=1121457 RepID=A0A1N6EXF4_9BACT|nr:PEP/pyruvate-binding domain-containing protein [Halodesulfovibrio marinisediminis]SIN87690.1 Pyruvate phosphate dikinase, PEP/pyruvate binding domain [Halodesulfovibrio marinisediminis DSM 17456]